MKVRLFRNSFLVTMAVCVLCFALIMTFQYRYFSKQHLAELKTEATYLAAAVEENGTDFLRDTHVDTKTRITWIAQNGDVLYDTNKTPSKMGNHADREEIIEARENGEGVSSRYSATISEKTTNYAIRLSDGTFLRVSTTQYSFWNLLVNMLYPMIAVLCGAAALSVFLAARTARSATDPINQIDLENPDEKTVYEELKPLVRRLNAQNRQIRRQMEELRREHEKQDDMRREFTANVSHELKTPLTSISGYAEIIRDGMVAPEDIPSFAGKIYDEARRLVTLVGDIIKLSRLDGREVNAEKTEIDLYETCGNTLAVLQDAADKKGLQVHLSGGHEKIVGVEQIIDEIVYNLCDNAIKYNRPQGSVDVSVRKEADSVVLSVRDTGIGIPRDELHRVFERFYRVDKSHSREMGGTGLGLSIVKHGASYHGARTEIESELGKGTEIRVIFPNVP